MEWDRQHRPRCSREWSWEWRRTARLSQAAAASDARGNRCFNVPVLCLDSSADAV
jgi:hypothetical protein